MGAHNISDSMVVGQIVGGNDKEIEMREKNIFDLERELEDAQNELYEF